MTEEEIVRMIKDVAPENMDEAVAMLSVTPGERIKTDPVADIITRFEIEGGCVVVVTCVRHYHKLRIYISPPNSKEQTLHWEVK